MKATVFCSMIALGIAPMATVAEEVSSSFSWGDVIFQPRVYVGYADYELKSGTFKFTPEQGSPETIRLGFNAQDDDKLSFSGFIGGIGGTVATGRFFGDFYYQSTLNETALAGGEGFFGGFPWYSFQNFGDVDAKHYDWALSLGYTINDQWSIYAGYKFGKTDWDQSNQSVGGFSLGGVLNSTFRGNGNIDGKFEQHGPFLGTSYSFPIGSGALTFKMAYAYLDGEWIKKASYTNYWNRGETEWVETGNSQTKLDGNSNAYSLGLSWTQSLTNNFSYSIGLNYHRYEFDLSGSGTIIRQLDGGPVFSPGKIDDVTLTEELFTLTATMTYRF